MQQNLYRILSIMRENSPEGSTDTEEAGFYSTDTIDERRIVLDQVGETPFLTKEEEQVATRLHKQIQQETTDVLQSTKIPLLTMVRCGKLKEAMQDIAKIILKAADDRGCLPKSVQLHQQDDNTTRSHTIHCAHITLEHVLENIQGQHFSMTLSKKESDEANLLQNALTMSESKNYLAALGTIITSQDNVERIDSARTLITITPHVLRILRERVKKFDLHMKEIDTMVSDAFATAPLCDYVERYEAKKGPMRIDSTTPRTILIESNLLLAAHRAKQFRVNGMTFLDLLDQATLGIIWGIEKFEPERNWRLQTYIMNWIRSLMGRAIETTTDDLKPSREAQQSLHVFERAQDSLGHKLGRRPLAEELRKQLGWTQERFNCVQKDAKLTKIPSSSKEGKDMLASMPGKENHPEILIHEYREFLQLAFKKLSARERLVLQKRFGLTDSKPQTLEQVGKELGVTRERIRQIESDALAKLQEVAHKSRLVID